MWELTAVLHVVKESKSFIQYCDAHDPASFGTPLKALQALQSLCFCLPQVLGAKPVFTVGKQNKESSFFTVFEVFLSFTWFTEGKHVLHFACLSKQSEAK